MTVITSLQNARVKDAIRLRDGRHRRKQGRILIDGARELARAIDAGVRLLEVFVCRALCTSDAAKRILDVLPNRDATVLHVSERVFGKLAFGNRLEGLLGVAATPRKTLAEIALPEDPLVAVLVGVEKPGNIGAAMRAADGAGVSAMVVADGGTDLYNPSTIRTSLGSIFALPVATATTGETIDWLKRNELAVYAARVDGSVPYTEVDYRGPTAIVLGSEAAGLSEAWSADWITSVRLPMLGVADSLNVSATSAVLFYEARWQRSQKSNKGKGAPR